MTFKEYAKCIWANKFTTMGLVATAGIMALGSLSPDVTQMADDVRLLYGALVCATGVASVSGLGMTIFGIETYSSFKTTQALIARHGRVHDLHRHFHRTYCNDVGVALAIKEAGIEELLE